MKRRFSILLIATILLLTLLACNIGPLSIDLGGTAESEDAGDGVASESEIEAGINAPAPNAVLPVGPAEIAYYATSIDGVAAIELSVNGEVLSTVASPDTSQQVVALKYSWTPTISGSHTIRVRAMDAKGNWSDFAAVTVNVESSQQAQPNNPPAQAEQPKATDTPSATATPEEMTIYNVKHDKDIFYYGGGTCGPREITIEADITHADDAYAAIIFFRFWDKEGAGLSSWSSGNAMVRKSDEHFSITLASDDIQNYGQFEFAVMYYQIKVQSAPPNPEILAGTEVIKQVELRRCP